MSDAGFRWAVIVSLAVIALSLYALSGMVAIGMSRRLPLRETSTKDDR